MEVGAGLGVMSEWLHDDCCDLVSFDDALFFRASLAFNDVNDTSGCAA